MSGANISKAGGIGEMTREKVREDGIIKGLCERRERV